MKKTKKSKWVDGCFTEIVNEIIRSPFISNDAFRIFSIIASYNPSHPSYTTIQTISRTRRATVSYRIKELIARKIVKYSKGNSLKKANKYFINYKRTDWDLFTPAEMLILEDGKPLGKLEERSERLKKLKEEKEQFPCRTSSSTSNAPTGSHAELVTVPTPNQSSVPTPNSNKNNLKKNKYKNNSVAECQAPENGPAPSPPNIAQAYAIPKERAPATSLSAPKMKLTEIQEIDLWTGYGGLSSGSIDPIDPWLIQWEQSMRKQFGLRDDDGS